MTRVGVAVPAAGSGRRMGGVRKPFLELLDEPVLLHALRPFLADSRVERVVVALSESDAASPPPWLVGLDQRVRIVSGGETRGASVRGALAAIPDQVDLIAVHDAARPLVTVDTVRRCIDLAESGTGVVAGSPAIDTLKRVDEDGDIVETPDRRTIWHAHTPQVFPAAALRRAYASRQESATDDAALVENGGLRVRMVDDGGFNLKVTRPDDVVVAEAILRRRRGA